MRQRALIEVIDDTCYLSGSWDVGSIDELVLALPAFSWPNNTELVLDVSKLSKLDSAGAILLNKVLQTLDDHGVSLKEDRLNEQQKAMLSLVASKLSKKEEKPVKPKRRSFFYWLGFLSISQLRQLDGFIVLLGRISRAFFQALIRPSLFELRSIVKTVEITGFQALGIVAMLSFLIGVVLAYQMGIQLEAYGASIYIAYVCGIALLREFSPLITAIIVAGRTSSSYTAQIGSMKIREEIDAIRTMGFNPIQLLVLPKIIGLLIAFPLLTFCSDLFGVFGSMAMAKIQLGINYGDFLSHFKESVGFKQFFLGMVKTPFFAFIIAMVGCYQGFKVESSANSVGLQTTKSVVQSIFLIIVADAIFSILYTWIGV